MTRSTREVSRGDAPDKDDEGWGDLIVFEESYLTDEHRFVSDTGSFQFEGKIVDIDEVHTPQSTLLALLRDHETHLTRQSKQSKTPSGDTSSRLGLVQESDDELLFLEACFQAQGIKGPQAKSKAKIKKSKEASGAETREYSKQFQEAKLAEIQSWIDNDVYDLVDLRKLPNEKTKLCHRTLGPKHQT